MRQALAKKLFAGSAAAITAIFLGLMPAAPAFAQNYPTMKVTGGDLSAGGWFGSNCSNTGTDPNFQDMAYTGGGSITDKSAGGIYTYSGTSSAYAAFALGNIDKTASSAPNGFNSSAAVGGAQDRLSFTNVFSGAPSGYIGGLWDDGIANSAQCIPDYYKDKQPPGGATPQAGSFGGSIPDGAYIASGSPFVLSSNEVTINNGQNISVFVNGNVYITHDIKYQGGDTAKNIPKFALVATGNIYVAPNVIQLDGLYIAQPGTGNVSFNSSGAFSASKGEFWTCGDPTKTTVDSTFLQGCKNTLTVNGAVIAKKVLLLRVDATNGAKEVFNYTPEMVVGGAFFPGSVSASGSGSDQPKFDKIISLPPVF